MYEPWAVREGETPDTPESDRCKIYSTAGRWGCFTHHEEWDSLGRPVDENGKPLKTTAPQALGYVPHDPSNLPGRTEDVSAPSQDFSKLHPQPAEYDRQPVRPEGTGYGESHSTAGQGTQWSPQSSPDPGVPTRGGVSDPNRPMGQPNL